MNKTIGLQLIAFSLLLAAGGWLIHHLSPTLGQTTLVTALAGGLLCLGWGLRAVLGRGGKAWPILTLIAVSFVLLSQSVMGWWGASEPPPGHRPASAGITLLFALSIAMLMRIAYAGVRFDAQPPKPARAVEAPAPPSRPAPVSARAVKRA
jgi:hypothetical protein